MKDLKSKYKKDLKIKYKDKYWEKLKQAEIKIKTDYEEKLIKNLSKQEKLFKSDLNLLKEEITVLK